MQSINYGLILACICCYLFGSIPNGYLLVKFYCRKDIRNEGSGNVGTLNAYLVSSSKLLGVMVLILDFLKGLIPVILMLFLFKFADYFILISSIFIILGHNYPVWLNFKGGRGLASAAGVFLLLNFGFVIFWVIMWGIYYYFKKDVLASNLVATVSLAIITIIFQGYFITLSPLIHAEHYNLIILFTIIISLLIVIKHKTILSRLIPFTAKNL
jgi:glycerol-3-phosphate acyltransferase PlsY